MSKGGRGGGGKTKSMLAPSKIMGGGCPLPLFLRQCLKLIIYPSSKMECSLLSIPFPRKAFELGVDFWYTHGVEVDVFGHSSLPMICDC